jgi:AraC-like DNA-binding protein
MLGGGLMKQDGWRRNCTFTKTSGSASVEVARQLRAGENGALWLDQHLEVKGVYRDSFVAGPTAILEYVQIRQGTLSIGGVRYQHSVALLMPEYSITPVCYDNVISTTIAILFRPQEHQGNGNATVLFETNGGAAPSDARTLMELLSGCERRPLEIAATSELVLSAKKMLDADHKNGTPIADIAGSLGVSHSHLARRFKKEIGMSPIEYCHRLRIAEAAWMLSSGEKIAAVSMHVGYEDLSRFYKNFRKIMSHSPGYCNEIPSNNPSSMQ